MWIDRSFSFIGRNKSARYWWRTWRTEDTAATRATSDQRKPSSRNSQGCLLIRSMPATSIYLPASRNNSKFPRTLGLDKFQSAMVPVTAYFSCNPDVISNITRSRCYTSTGQCQQCFVQLVSQLMLLRHKLHEISILPSVTNLGRKDIYIFFATQ